MSKHLYFFYIKYKPSFRSPCICLRNLLVPYNFSLKDLYLENATSSSNCIKNIIVPYLDKTRINIIWLQKIPLFDAQSNIASDLQASLAIRRWCKMDFNFNLGDIAICYQFIHILLQEFYCYIKEGYMSGNYQQNIVNIQKYYKEQLTGYRSSLLYTYKDETFFYEKINPILYFNFIYAPYVFQCIKDPTIYQNIILVPFINTSLSALVDYDCTI